MGAVKKPKHVKEARMKARVDARASKKKNAKKPALRASTASWPKIEEAPVDERPHLPESYFTEWRAAREKVRVWDARSSGFLYRLPLTEEIVHRQVAIEMELLRRDPEAWEEASAFHFEAA